MSISSNTNIWVVLIITFLTLLWLVSMSGCTPNEMTDFQEGIDSAFEDLHKDVQGLQNTTNWILDWFKNALLYAGGGATVYGKDMVSKWRRNGSG